MGTGLEANVYRPPPCAIPGLLKGKNLRMLEAVIRVGAGADNLTIVHDDAAHHRPRTGQPPPLLSEVKSLLHVDLVVHVISVGVTLSNRNKLFC